MPSDPSAPPPAADDWVVWLNEAPLGLSPEVRKVRLGADRILVHYQPGRRSLVLTAAEWRVLQRFQGARPVPVVLRELLGEQVCPPLRDFYELVAQALRAGILTAAGRPPPPVVAPTRWPLRLPGGFARGLALLAMPSAVGGLMLRPLGALPAWADALAGWLIVGGVASVGTCLAAAVVRAAGGEVYGLRLCWRSFLPRIEADLADARLGGVEAEIDVALARMAPHFLAVAVATWWWPALVPLVLGGVFWVWSPGGPSPLRTVFGALYRDPRVAQSPGRLLGEGRAGRWSGRQRRWWADGSYRVACVAAAAGWWGAVLLAAVALGEVNLLEAGRRLAAAAAEWAGWVAPLGAALGLALGLLLFWKAGARLRRWWRDAAQRRRHRAAVLRSPEARAEWLAQTVLFRELPATELAAVAAAMRPEPHRRGGLVVREGERGSRMFVVLSGRLEVRREFAPGRSEPVARLGAGEAFGEVALLEDGVRTRSVRALTACVLLALERADFERLVLSQMSREAVARAVQITGFLQQTELTRGWSPALRAALAARMRVREAPAGSVLVEEGRDNLWFFVVRRGELAVRQGRRELRRLQPGESFGELSLLRDGKATATVVVVSRLASCLVVNGREFLDLVTRDCAAAMQWEEQRKQPREEAGRRRAPQAWW